MAEKTIQEIYGMQKVGDVRLVDGIYFDNMDWPDPELLMGVELEIEDFRERTILEGWNLVEDGSLRNGGREAISAPTPAKQYEDMLTKFFNGNRITPRNYSDRCSTHVHVNVQDMTLSQLKVFCMVYCIFERLLFKFVGNYREENIYCVPWYQSGLSPQFIDRLAKNYDTAIRGWIKYSALNLLPVRAQGTVEFRHLHGTCDVPTIKQWMRFISRMVVYAKATTWKALTENILEMNTVSNYDMFMTDVFQADTPILMKDNYKESLSVGVVDAKLMLVKPKVLAKEKETAKHLTAAETEEILNAMRAQIPRARPARPARPAGDLEAFRAEQNRLLRAAIQPMPVNPPQAAPIGYHNWVAQTNAIAQIEREWAAAEQAVIPQRPNNQGEF